MFTISKRANANAFVDHFVEMTLQLDVLSHVARMSAREIGQRAAPQLVSSDSKLGATFGIFLEHP